MQGVMRTEELGLRRRILERADKRGFGLVRPGETSRRQNSSTTNTSIADGLAGRAQLQQTKNCGVAQVRHQHAAQEMKDRLAGSRRCPPTKRLKAKGE